MLGLIPREEFRSKRLKGPAIEANYQMMDGVLVIDMRTPFVGYALRRWAVDCTDKNSLDPKSHHLRLKNLQTPYGVESAALAPCYASQEANS